MARVIALLFAVYQGFAPIIGAPRVSAVLNLGTTAVFLRLDSGIPESNGLFIHTNARVSEYLLIALRESKFLHE